MFNEYPQYSQEDFDRIPPQVPKLKKVGDIFVYRVRPGDNVYRIARAYETKIEYIVCMNGLNNDMMIFPGQELLIPVIRQKMAPRQEDSYDLYF